MRKSKLQIRKSQLVKEIKTHCDKIAVERDSIRLIISGFEDVLQTEDEALELLEQAAGTLSQYL